MKSLVLFFASCLAAHATFCSSVGWFYQPTGTQPQTASVTTSDARGACGTGGNYQPKAVMFFGSNQTATGTAVNYRQTIGFASGAGLINAQANWVGAADGVTPSTTATGRLRDIATYLRYTEAGGSSTEQAGCYISAISSTGFTFDCITIADGLQPIINYIAFGGTDITGAAAGTIGPPASNNGLVTVGSLSFIPTVVFFAVQASSKTYAAMQGFAACTISSCVGNIIQATNNGTNSQARSLQSSNLGPMELATSSGAYFAGGTVTAMDCLGQTPCTTSGEFITTWPISGGVNAATVAYLAIGGGIWQTGSFLQPASIGAQTVLMTGMVPASVIVSSANNTANAGTSPSSTARFTLGATDGTNQEVHWMGYTNAVGTTVAKQDLDQTSIVKLETEASGGPTVNAAAAVTGLTGGSMGINWSSADATAREIIWVAGGTYASPPPFGLLWNFPLGIN